MDLRVLEYFLAAAQEGNITNAAASLHVSQPTVSRQLKELEEELGKTLFVRTNRNVQLTEEGILFKETAENILMLYDKAHNRMMQDSLEGDYYIGAAEVESFSLVAEKIRSFRQKHPKVRIHIWSDYAERISDAVRLGTLDIGFILHSVDTMQFETHTLSSESEWGVLVRCDHPLAAKEAVTMEDLQNETLIIPENSAFQNEIHTWNNDVVVNCCYYTLVRNAMIMTQHGIGITVCLRMKTIPEGTCFIPITPIRTAGSMLIWKKKPAYSAIHTAFLKEFGI